jgi:hypothetical protein
MTKSRPIEITFRAKQKMAGLEIVAGLNVTDEYGDAAIQVVTWNVQAATGSSPTEICA